ncbi:precorrin-8X methylmutase CbiC [Gottschalkia acidurici 9a]|uniref:Precorrin-8X methylmutase CbiC n=1 Tax=Gottschalkia acidurici (strain ATCC 7906 / DSM 604 / BCRC 14475 / CIP 104303 / KCTC 5404 / NCIMB 10678 / 9a) TaxID=1128398 RepID=K0B4K9_GOTA9|nr:precorrin-8X methylmutase [Gottschalkia acidurici]AFS79486.1 precorrin-8X methylmutase CbiC [Gottschalkia acidurici 9a]
MYIKNPELIETKSFEIIDEGMTPHSFTDEELNVVKRTIHTTGDFDYQNIVIFKNSPIEVGINTIKNGCRIVTDTKMGFSGINKTALNKANCTLDNYISHEDVFRIAKEKEITRSMAAVDFALSEGVDIFVVGNAPTALFRIGELIKEGKASPKLIIGVPVGFVGAKESKEYIREFDIPTITTKGTKGGSNVAAAIVNALLYMAVGR